MITWRSIISMILLSAMVLMGVACSGNEPPSQLAGVKQEGQSATMEQKEPSESAAAQQSQPGDEPVQTAQQAATGEKAIELTGTVEQGSEGVVLVTDLGKYNVIGQDLSEMVGKTIKVTGAVEESAGQYTINVLSFSESQ